MPAKFVNEVPSAIQLVKYEAMQPHRVRTRMSQILGRAQFPAFRITYDTTFHLRSTAPSLARSVFPNACMGNVHQDFD